MGIMNMNVLFFADTQSGYGVDGFGASTLTVFDFDNFIVNGVAFWSLGDATGIDVDVSQGCVQSSVAILAWTYSRATRTRCIGIPRPRWRGASPWQSRRADTSQPIQLPHPKHYRGQI